MSLTNFLRSSGRWLWGTTPAAEPDRGGRLPRRAGAERSANRRYCLTLSAQSDTAADEHELALAWQSLETDMALVPAGDVELIVPVATGHDGDPLAAAPTRQVNVRSVYLDRCAVSNADFALFVAAGGYRDPGHWPAQLLPQVLQFTDRTGRPGPRYWSDGEPPADKLDHPVVGISWYEAYAYAAWTGKRLPTSAEWQRAACWSDGDGTDRRYPWGNSFVPNRANTWLGGPGHTQAVNSYYDGCTPNGIYQLVGNVWEWTATAFECQSDSPNSEVLFDQPMAEVRGGAFDTYFETQATCQFRSGQPMLRRAVNLGFRCCVSTDSLRKLDQPSAYFDPA